MKSRKLSILEYLDQLQKEFVMYELRIKIYKNSTDIEYFKKSINLKKEKIIEISDRNQLDNIFNNNDLKKEYYLKINSFEGPYFEYRDFFHKKKLLEKDLFYYYYPESDIKIKDKNILIGKIKTTDFIKKICLCSIKGQEKDKYVTFNNISRIL